MPAVVLAERTATGRPDANVAVDADPLATFPRRIQGRAPDGHPWELLTSRTGVAVMSETGRLAEAHVVEEPERVVVDFRPTVPGLPADIGACLVRQAFAHPAVRAHRAILVTLPRGESAVLERVLAHLEGARSRVAGVTCLVEGHVRNAAG